MQYTIKGKKKGRDVILTDDRLICEGKEYLYKDMSKISTLNFMGTSIDCTYKGRHQAFKIDKSVFSEATEAAELAQKVVEQCMLERFRSAENLTRSDAMYRFCKENGLMEPLVPERLFCPRMDAILSSLAPGERVLLPFESKCGFGIMLNPDQQTVTSFKEQEFQCAGALTDSRIMLYTFGTMGSRERTIPLSQIYGMRNFKQGLTQCLLIVTKDMASSTAIMSLGMTEAVVMQKMISAQMGPQTQ